MPAEHSLLERALLLTPDVKLSAALLSGIDAQMARLASVIRDRLRDVLLKGDGAHSLDAMAAMTARTRRSLESTARILGCTMRAMDAQFLLMTGVTCSGLRAEPMGVEEVAERIVRRLTKG
ncbi:MAG TPA: hypothetical protein VN602_00545 [Gemmatimonadaceae bacterium]|nr:hypothetical protein [Gemmatimonadaceae bacterium]